MYSSVNVSTGTDSCSHINWDTESPKTLKISPVLTLYTHLFLLLRVTDLFPITIALSS